MLPFPLFICLNLNPGLSPDPASCFALISLTARALALLVDHVILVNLPWHKAENQPKCHETVLGPAFHFFY